MLKKLLLSLSLLALSVTASGCISPLILRKIAIQKSLTHITQEKNTIFLELQKTIVFSEKAIQHMQKKLPDAYATLASEITTVINKIVASEEFSDSLNAVTDFQLICIADNAMHFDDIAYNPADYSINQRIDTELAEAFPSLDEQTEQLFNIYYVTIANSWGSTLLITKLELKEKELNEELKSLEPSSQPIAE